MRVIILIFKVGNANYVVESVKHAPGLTITNAYLVMIQSFYLKIHVINHVLSLHLDKMVIVKNALYFVIHALILTQMGVLNVLIIITYSRVIV